MRPLPSLKIYLAISYQKWQEIDFDSDCRDEDEDDKERELP